MPYTPWSKTCLATHWLPSPPLGGMRTNGVTAGANVPRCRICRRSSMYCRQSRKARMSYGRCSISNTTPSYDAAFIACATPISALQKLTKAGLPCSNAAITPLRRGVSAIIVPPEIKSAHVRSLPSVKPGLTASPLRRPRISGLILANRLGLGNQPFDRGEMVLPAGCPPARKATELGGAARRSRQRIIDDGAAPTEPVEGIEVLRHVAAILAQGGKVAAQDGNPEGQRLDQRKPEPFGKGWQQQCLSDLDEARCLDIP